jgi:hypothetical protein
MEDRHGIPSDRNKTNELKSKYLILLKKIVLSFRSGK